MTKTLTGEEANTVEKETQANILSWCVTEFKESAADLPRFKDIPNSETGRACKQAALAFGQNLYADAGLGQVEQPLIRKSSIMVITQFILCIGSCSILQPV